MRSSSVKILSMKTKLIVIIVMFLFPTMAWSENFTFVNTDGVELKFQTLAEEGMVTLLYNRDDNQEPNERRPNYPNLHIDTLRIPERVSHNECTYLVTSLSPLACAYMDDVKVVILPVSIKNISYDLVWGWRNSFTWNRLQSIKVSPENPYFSDSLGILYTKDKKTLIAYPTANSNDTVIVDEGVEVLAATSFYVVENINYLELPLSLKRIDRYAIGSNILKHIVIKDNVDTLATGAITGWSLNHITLGKGLKSVGSYFVETDSTINIYCRAEIPPVFSSSGRFLSENILEHGMLHVPMQSVVLYQQAEGWKEFGQILPIEPPIVTGVDTASVSWVQNFSATGYMWTLYTDEAKTQRFMSLTFDANGHLTHIDINSGHMPARMPALHNEDGEEEKRFAEYYSFTISGLSPDTKYYYTRQSLSGTTVIDEETGSFETLSSETEGLNDNVQSDKGQRTKVLRAGQVLIHSGTATYSVEGIKIGK